ncbi:MAG: hypothetical protein EA398_04625 [Deltaproteobacteria bacterium]|nr:MAG: hypothetical protein EA398_04625 [Deltaproteobacteria bacterium]
MIAADMDPDRQGDFVAVVALGIGSASLLSRGILATSERPALELLSRAGLLRTVPLPFFRAELVDPASLDRCRSSWRPVVLPALLVMLALAAPLLLVLQSTPELKAGVLHAPMGTAVEHYRASRAVDGRLREHLGARLTLLGVAQAGDGAWVARLRFDDLVQPRGTTVDLRAGESVRVRGRRIGIAEVAGTDRAGSAVVQVRGLEGEARETLRLVPGVRQRIEIDGIQIELVRATFARLGALGPAAHMRVFRNDELLRDVWLYQSSPDFDHRHAETAPSMALLDVIPAHSVTLHVSRVPPVDLALVVTALVLAVVGLLAILVLRTRLLVRGRDGDYELMVLGAFPAVNTIVRDIVGDALFDDWQKLGAPEECAAEGGDATEEGGA